MNLVSKCVAIIKRKGERPPPGAAPPDNYVYLRRSTYEQAINFYEQSLAIAQQIGTRRREGNALANLGGVYRGLGQYERAIDFYEQSLAIAQQIGDRRGEGITLGNLGNTYNSLGQYPQAIDTYQQAIAISQAIGDRNTEGFLLSNLGLAYAAQNQPEPAIRFLQQSVDVREAIRQDIRNLPQAQQQAFVDSVSNTYRRLAELLQQEGQVEEAQRILELLNP